MSPLRVLLLLLALGAALLLQQLPHLVLEAAAERVARAAIAERHGFARLVAMQQHLGVDAQRREVVDDAGHAQIEAVCKPESDGGAWLRAVDLVEDGDALRLVAQATDGPCERECATVTLACEAALEGAISEGGAQTWAAIVFEPDGLGANGTYDYTLRFTLLSKIPGVAKWEATTGLMGGI